jgi:hypothetical protein
VSTTAPDAQSRRMFEDFSARHRRPASQLGCSLPAHRDLGFCALCIGQAHRNREFGRSTEIAGWRLLAMAERGIPLQPWESS